MAPSFSPSFWAGCALFAWAGRLTLAEVAFGPCSASARGPWLGRAEPMPAEPMPSAEDTAEATLLLTLLPVAAGGAACRDAAVPASQGGGAGARVAPEASPEAGPEAGPGAGRTAKAARRTRAIATRPMRVRVCAASVRRSLERE